MYIIIIFISICPLAQSYVTKYSTPGAAAELTASRKSDNNTNLPNSYLFQPIALKNLGENNESATSLITAKSALNRIIQANEFLCFRAFL